jgi:hypothetical protein
MKIWRLSLMRDIFLKSVESFAFASSLRSPLKGFPSCKIAIQFCMLHQNALWKLDFSPGFSPLRSRGQNRTALTFNKQIGERSWILLSTPSRQFVLLITATKFPIDFHTNSQLSGYHSCFYSEGSEFESQPPDLLHGLKMLVVFLNPSSQVLG